MEFLGVLILACLGLTIFVVLPGLLCWGMQATMKAPRSRYAIPQYLLLVAILIGYGIVLMFVTADFHWNGFSPVTDAAPRFGFGSSPSSSDYLNAGWPGTIWMVVGVLSLVRLAWYLGDSDPSR